MIPNLSINSQGIIVINDTTRELLINPLEPPNNNDFPLLGLTFLTSAYLMADFDQGQFTLWKAAANETQDIRAVAPSSTCIIANSPQQSATGIQASPGPTFANQSAQPGSSTGISTGGIAGAAVGGVAFVILFALAWRYIRRAKQRRKYHDVPESSAESKTRLSQLIDSQKLMRTHELQELPSEVAQELGPDRPHEMGQGLPHEVATGGHTIPYELDSGLPSPKPLPSVPRSRW